MTAHTRAPWRNDGGEIIGNSRIVATMAWCSGLGPEDEANARLIAAAPTMLAALREIEWIFDGKEDINNDGGPNDAMRALALVQPILEQVDGKS